MEFTRGADEDLFDDIMFSSLENNEHEYKRFAKRLIKSKSELRMIGNTLCKYERRGRIIIVRSSKDNGKTFRTDMYRPKRFTKRKEIQTIVGDLAWHDAVITTGM